MAAISALTMCSGFGGNTPFLARGLIYIPDPSGIAGAGTWVLLRSGSLTYYTGVNQPDRTIVWTSRTLPGASFPNTLRFGAGTAMMTTGTTPSHVYTTTDGISWTTQADAATFVSDVAYTAGEWMYVTSNTPYVSTDGGVSWTPVSVTPGVVTMVAGWGGSFWAIGGSGNNYRSDDNGNSWTTLTIAPSLTNGICVHAADGALMVMGDTTAHTYTMLCSATSWSTINWLRNTSSTFHVTCVDGVWIVCVSATKIGVSTDQRVSFEVITTPLGTVGGSNFGPLVACGDDQGKVVFAGPTGASTHDVYWALLTHNLDQRSVSIGMS